jgi:hypothetical protein
MADYDSNKQLHELDASSAGIDGNSLIPCQSSPGQRLGSVKPADIVEQTTIDDIQDGVTSKKISATEKTNYDDHLINTSNPHVVTKTQVGLGNVNNTSDVNKPISNATQAALDLKSPTTHLHTGTYEPANANIQSHIGSTSNPHTVTKTQVGLGNVPNIDTSNATNITTGTLDEGRIDTDIARLTQVVEKSSATGSAKVPVGTEGQRDGAPSPGYLRFNTDAGSFEGYNGAEWGSIGGGLDWNVYTTDQTTKNNGGYVMNTTSSPLTVTLHASPAAGDIIGIADLRGTFNTNNCTVDRNGGLIHELAEDLLLDVKNQRVTLLCTVGGASPEWIITELEPNNSQFEYMPYAVMHVQDQKPSGTGTGTSSTGVNVRTLNFEVRNEIAGASLNSNQITLPAGEYSIEAEAPMYGSGGTTSSKLRLYCVTTASYVIEGTSTYVISSGSENCSLSGNLVTTSQQVFELHHYMSTGGLNNLGVNANQGTEVYADLKITKIGGNYAPKPVISSARYQTVPNLNTEGGIMGGDVTVSGNTLTIGKTSCLDATLAIPLSTTTDTTVVLPATVNQDFYVFIVRLVDGVTYTMKAYTTYAGPASDTDIDAFRFVSYAKNNGSGVTMPYRQVGCRIDWTTAERPIVATSITSSYVSYSLSSILPTSLLIEIGFWVSTAVASSVNMSYDGVTHIVGAGTTYGESALLAVLPVSSIYIKCVSTSTAVKIGSVTLRR